MSAWRYCISWQRLNNMSLYIITVLTSGKYGRAGQFLFGAADVSQSSVASAPRGRKVAVEASRAALTRAHKNGRANICAVVYNGLTNVNLYLI